METADAPPRKKVRKGASTQKSDQLHRSGSSKHRLFTPFRALGLITNHIPLYIQTRSYKGATDGPRIHVLTCLGRSWAMWEGGKMGLLFVGPEAEFPISSLTMDGDAVWATSGPHAIKYLRGKEIARAINPSGSSLASILIFGSQLLALTEDGAKLLLWDISKAVAEFAAVIQFDIGFTATSLLHPATYVNKVLVASKEGDMQLWNIRAQTCIHTISRSKLLTSASSSESLPSNAITALTQSPAIDVVGVGFISGEISVYDVRADERLMRMYMDGGGIRALGFRSDGHQILASASSSGNIALWDLNSGGRLLHLVRGAHDGAVTAVEWVPGQPVLISSGEDNSVKQWLFDSPTAAPRLLKFRSGHQSPPHLIRYYGEDGKQLLTASTDRSLRYTSVVRDSRSFEMSQGSLVKKAAVLAKPLASLKFPAITAMSMSTTRAKDWDDVLTAHVDEPFARSWTVQGKRLGKHTLNYAEGGKRKMAPGSVKSVSVTACGNFGIAGSTTGEIHMWNMQSGLKRKTFKVGPCPQSVVERLQSKNIKSSERVITGLASDSLNQSVIASTSDGTINFFDFHTANLEHTVTLPSSITSIVLQRDSGLLATICEDYVVRLIDIETRRLVRELPCGSKGRILDVTFSPDSRWLVVTSMDLFIRTFDIPTGRLIDAFRTPSVATSVAFSPTNDFLATSHIDSVGVYLWANRAQYSEVSFKSISENDVVETSLPSMQGEEDEEGEALEALSALTVDEKPLDSFATPQQLDEELVTLTLLPRARWQTLLNLEVITQRNKPKEPPKKPEKAPFFLPTLPGVEQRFSVEEKDETEGKHTRKLDKVAAKMQSKFQKKLANIHTDADYDVFFTYVKSLSPAAIDLEIRSLVTLDSFRQFLRAMTHRLVTHRDFEAVQAFLNVFFRLHGDVVTENAEMQEALLTLLEVQQKESNRVLELLTCSLGALGFIRDTL